MVTGDHALAPAACMLSDASQIDLLAHRACAHQVLDHPLERGGARVADVVGAQPRECVQQVAPLALRTAGGKHLCTAVPLVSQMLDRKQNADSRWGKIAACLQHGTGDRQATHVVRVCRVWSGAANLAAAVQRDADGGQADRAGAGVHQHTVRRHQAAAHDQAIVCRQVRHRHRRRVAQAPRGRHVPHLAAQGCWVDASRAHAVHPGCP